MLPDQTPLEHWQDGLQAVVAGLSLLDRVTVLRETTSTQDAARRLNARPGHLVVTGRQTAGRGRLRRRWADTGDDGIAFSFVCGATDGPAPAIRAAVGVAFGVEEHLGNLVQLKWPNDLCVDGRKLGGILIEAADGRHTVGIGLNVLQTEWDAELQHRAISLRQLGIEADRLAVLESVLRGLDRAWALAHTELEKQFSRRDCLSGTRVVFRSHGEQVEGLVTRVDPMRGIELETAAGSVWLDAATTSVVPASQFD